MYSPKHSDYYYEWIELYNPTNTTVDINGWTIWDGQEEDTIQGDTDHGNGTTRIPAYSYAIITDQGTKIYQTWNIPNTTIRLNVDDAAICGNGLKNTGEFLLLNASDHTTIDAIEWGENTKLIPGHPAYNVNNGETLIHHTKNYTTPSILRYTNGLNPTPGTSNTECITTPLLPKYLAKPPNPNTPSQPISIQLQLKNLKNNSYYCKTYLLGNLSNHWPASQTWNSQQWQYSNNYTHHIIINSTKTITQWLHLRIHPHYKEFKNYLRNNSHAYLIIKLKNQSHTYHLTHKINLLDMNTYTTNATTGGYHRGQLNITQHIQQNTPILLKNHHNTLITQYFLENNSITDDHTPTLPGYYKLPAPINQEYTLYTITQNNTYHQISNNIIIQPGDYHHKLLNTNKPFITTAYHSTNHYLTIKNTGSFPDTYLLQLQSSSSNWDTTITPKSITLQPHELAYITITTTPHPPQPGLENTITITATSQNDPIQTKTIQTMCQLQAPDLLITNYSLWNAQNQKQTTFIQGQPIRLKIHVKNQGTLNATNISIHYYLKKSPNNQLIDSKNYDAIGKYQKYPSIYIDTTTIPPGTHTIRAHLDPKNTILESDETNNHQDIQITILPLSYDNNATSLKINELYYYSYPTCQNEYFSIINPTNTPLNLTGYYLTTTPEKPFSNQRKLFLPHKPNILPGEQWFITQNASAYYHDTRNWPHFEYKTNSVNSIPNLNTTHTITFSNAGSTIALKTPTNQTIDLICYGNSVYDKQGWEGPSIKTTGKGVILKRNHLNTIPVDTNTSKDWQHPRIHRIGQSELLPTKICFTGNITPFISPDTSHAIITQQILNAKKSILLNMYEFTNPYLYETLLSALKRNVKLKIFMEGSPIGGIDEREQYILTSLAQHGAKIQFIISNAENHIYARYRFDHAKYLVIDNETVIIESCNWVKTGIPIDPSFGNREWGIIIDNSTVAHYFYQAFHHDFNPECKDSCNIKYLDFQIPQDFILDSTIYHGNYQPQFSSPTIYGNYTVTPVFSPDNSNITICNLIDSAKESIYIQQLYIYPYWENGINPFLTRILEKAKEGIDIRIILNYNPAYGPTNDKINITHAILKRADVEVKFIYTNWSIFTNVHNKGMIVDNTSVLISSINWNENSVLNNREAGVIIENQELATYFSQVFFHDWSLDSNSYIVESSFSLENYSDQIIIVVVYVFTFALIIRDWRKRQWT